MKMGPNLTEIRRKPVLTLDTYLGSFRAVLGHGRRSSGRRWNSGESPSQTAVLAAVQFGNRGFWARAVIVNSKMGSGWKSILFK
jgi:hypothetical protein